MNSTTVLVDHMIKYHVNASLVILGFVTLILIEIILIHGLLKEEKKNEPK